MSCPDWPFLAARREHREGGAEEAWRAALDHLDGCGACRSAALAADPLLLFRDLPVPAPAPEEIAAIRLGVAALRRARGRRAGRSWRSAGARFAAALLLPTVALLAGGSLAPSPPAVLHRASPPPAVAAPVLERLDRPRARVYELRHEDLAVVMIVDETLDV